MLWIYGYIFECWDEEKDISMCGKRDSFFCLLYFWGFYNLKLLLIFFFDFVLCVYIDNCNWFWKFNFEESF